MSAPQAQEYAALGYKVFPCQPQGKAPATKNSLKDATTDLTRIRRWPGGYNLGLLPPEGVVVVDADTREEAERVQREYPELGEASRQDTPKGGAHFVLRLPEGVTPPKASTRVQGRPLDVRGLAKAYIVTEPSATSEGIYKWVRPLVSPDKLPVASMALLSLLTPPEKTPAAPPTIKTTVPREGDRTRRYALAALQAEHDEVASAADGTRNHALNRAAYSLGQLVGAGALERDEVEEALRGAAQTCRLDPRETESTLKSGLEAGIAAPREMPEKSKAAPRAATQAREVAAPAGEPTPPPDLLKYPRTEYGNSERLQALFGHHIKNCVGLGWLAYDGKRYRRDEDGSAVRRFALETARELFTQAARLDGDQRETWVKWALACERAASIKNTVELAKTLPGMTIEVEQLDANPMLFNCSSGTLDLQTRRLKPHDPRDLITKLASVTFDPDAECPKWLEVQHTICAGDDDLIAFKQKAYGYALTGDTSEQCLFMLYGGGANGKSTELNIVAKAAGDYGTTAQFKTFEEQKNQGPRDDIADLAGTRFVSASEGGPRQRLDEAMVKSLTGDDLIKARHLYGTHFTFKPTMKLFLASNYRPRITGVDDAIWRRVLLIPYDVTIPPEERDKKLSEKLEAELSGILNWLVEGCQMWLRDGLGKSRAVRQATEEYRAESDELGEFISARCEVDPLYSEGAKELYTAYRRYSEDNGDEAVSSTAFGKMLGDRKFGRAVERRGTKTVRVRKGICLVESLAERGEA